MAINSISNLLRISPRFLRSAQLERDFSDPDALNGYVLTHEIRTNLARLAKGTRIQSGQRCWRITGDFGTGKSSFALLLANLFSPSRHKLPKQLAGLPTDLSLPRSRRGLLPVLVTGSRHQMSLALLSAFSHALHQNIDGRKKLKIRNLVDETLADPKSNWDQRSVALLSQAASELREQGLFDGVLVIIDELGKFLEYAALHPERQDIYFLQQLGEASTRSGENCLFTVGLLHQGFSSYADKLSGQGQREWEKVAGRFEEIVFSQPLSQMATLLREALNVREDHCPRGWKTEAQSDMRKSVELGIFGASAGKSSLIESAPSLYPLHPTILPVLAKFFRRFGQNERSLFSFLMSSEPHALQDFAQQEASLKSLYRLPEFYDFIALNFGNRLSAQSFRSHWNHIDAVIRSYPVERELELRILKTIGLLNTIDSTTDLLATDELLSLALGSPKSLPDALARLKKENLIFYRGVSRGYALWSHTSVNLEQSFTTAAESIQQTSSIGKVIRDRLDTRPIVARAHYIQTGTLRHFNIRFCSADEIEDNVTNFQPVHPADGLIVIVLSETQEQAIRAIKGVEAYLSHPQLIVGITEPLQVLNGLVLALERWHYVERHTPELKDDRYAAEEVSRQIAHANQTLENALQRYVGFRGLTNAGETRISWLYQGQQVKELSEGKSLQSFISQICKELFPLAPLIHNELVNRNSISSAAAAARQRLFNLMLNGKDKPFLGLPLDKAPPEKSLYLSVLHASGIHSEGKHGWAIQFPEIKDDVLQVCPALKQIVKILERQPEARVCVSEIFKELQRPPFGVRDGLLPILLLTVYIEHEAEIAVYEDGKFVSEMEEFLKMRLVKAPETFEFQLCRITGMRRELLSHLAAVMKVEKPNESELLSIVRPICTFLAELPEYSRNTDKLTPQTLALRAVIQAALEPADLIFRAIPEAIGGKEVEGKFDATQIASRVAASLSELRHAYPVCRKRIADVILKAFDEKAANFDTWRRAISNRAEAVVLGVHNTELCSFSLKLIDDATSEDLWLESMGSLITRCPPSRWKDKDEVAFGEGIEAFAKQFLRVESLCFGKDSLAPENAVRIALTRRTGEERDQVFHLTSEQVKESMLLRKKLQSQIPDDKYLAVAILSELLWEMLDQNHETPQP